MTRRLSETETDRHRGASSLRIRNAAPSAISQRRVAPRTREEVEERYVAARDAWTAAMRAANSGKAADLALLAIAQEAYEAAEAERQRWESGARVAIPVEPDPERDLSAIVGQELAWRQIRTTEEGNEGLLARLRRRLRRDEG